MGKMNPVRTANLQPKDAGTDARQFSCANGATLDLL